MNKSKIQEITPFKFVDGRMLLLDQTKLPAEET